MPKNVGAPMVRPPRPPVNAVALNTSASIAAATARVTTARLTPRTRSAGRPMISPSGTAVSAASRSGMGNGSPAAAPSWDRTNALSPTKDCWASDTWPT